MLTNTINWTWCINGLNNVDTSKLINYTIRKFVSENELELYAAKQDEILNS